MHINRTKDVDSYADDWLHPFPLIAKMMITVREATEGAQRKIDITMLDLAKLDL